MLTDSMDTFSSSLPLTLKAVCYLTSHFLFLGTLFSWPLVFSWLLLLIFFAGSSSPKRLHIVVSWDQCWIFFFLQFLLEAFFLFYDFTQQKSTKLPYLYLIWVLDLPNSSTWISHRYFVCNTSQTEIWTTPTSLPVLRFSKCHYHPPCYSGP